MADVTVVGGINIDIEGCPFNKLLYEDSNPGKVNMAFGGVGRNIAENVARLGGKVGMVSVIGDDFMGLAALDHLKKHDVDVKGIKVVEGAASATYLSILNDRNDMELAVCDMDILEHLTEGYLEGNAEDIRMSKVVALDGNLSEKQMGWLVENLEDVKFFYDPVSANKAVKGVKYVGNFYAIKPNVMEAEILSGMKLENEEDLRKAGKWFLQQGVKEIYITLNKNGVYYCNEEKDGFVRPGPVTIESATGAGDSFSAMILIGIAEGMDIEEIATMGMAAASITMESKTAVSKYMCREEVLRRTNNNV